MHGPHRQFGASVLACDMLIFGLVQVTWYDFSQWMHFILNLITFTCLQVEHMTLVFAIVFSPVSPAGPFSVAAVETELGPATWLSFVASIVPKSIYMLNRTSLKYKSHVII